MEAMLAVSTGFLNVPMFAPDVREHFVGGAWSSSPSIATDGSKMETKNEADAIYPDTLLAVFAGALALLTVAGVLGISGWLVENDNVTYWGMTAGLLGGLAVLYSARKAKLFLVRR